MPLGTPVLSSVSIVTVGLTSTPITPIGGMLSIDWVGDAPTNRRDYIGQATAVARGKIGRTMNLSWDYESTDTGQLLVEDLDGVVDPGLRPIGGSLGAELDHLGEGGVDAHL